MSSTYYSYVRISATLRASQLSRTSLKRCVNGVSRTHRGRLAYDMLNAQRSAAQQRQRQRAENGRAEWPSRRLESRALHIAIARPIAPTPRTPAICGTAGRVRRSPVAPRRCGRPPRAHAAAVAGGCQLAASRADRIASHVPRGTRGHLNDRKRTRHVRV